MVLVSGQCHNLRHALLPHISIDIRCNLLARWFLARLIFGHEDGCHTLHRNVGLFTEYAVSNIPEDGNRHPHHELRKRVQDLKSSDSYYE
jgi:hypothetical protein